MNSIDTKVIELTLDYDTDTENPLEDYDGMWKLYTFEGGWYGKGPTEFFTDRGDGRTVKWVPDTLDLFFKLRNGLAFTVGGYFHSGSSGTSVYVQDFDPEDKIAGLLVWEHKADEMGAKTKEERKEDAKSTLKTYEQWANGDCYWFAFEGPGEDDSCGGFIGFDYFCESVKEAVPDDRPLLIVASDEKTDAIFSHKMLPDGVEYMTRKEYREFLAEEDEEEGADAFDYDALEVA